MSVLFDVKITQLQTGQNQLVQGLVSAGLQVYGVGQAGVCGVQFGQEVFVV